MNEKEKKSLIIISSVFIFVLVFMVFFTFYRRDAMLSDRTIPKINTEIVEEDPPALGDTCLEYERVASGRKCTGVSVSSTACYSSCATMSEQACRSGPNGTMVGSSRCCWGSGWTTTYTNGNCIRWATPAPTTNTCTIANCSTYAVRTSSNCICGQCASGYHASSSGGSCIKDSTPTPTPATNTCTIANCSTYAVRTSSNCICGQCASGYHASSSGGSCIKDSTPTPTPSSTKKNCCYYGTTIQIDNNLSCTTIGASAAEGACTNPTPIPSSTKKNCCYYGTTIQIDNNLSCTTIGALAVEGACTNPTPTPDGNSIQCWSLTQSDKCSFVTVNGSKCDNSRNNYDTYAQCIGNITCGSSQVRNGGVCTTCSAIDSNSEPNSDNTACVCKSGYVKINGKCVSETSITAPCCINGITSSDASECKTKALSGENVSSGSCPTYKCCCNLASGHCSMATICTGSLQTTQSNITSAASCNALSSNYGSACYKDASGTYVWGVYGSDSSYKYIVSLDKDSCLKKNSGDSSGEEECTLRCPSTVLSTGETIMCTFEAGDGSTLSSSSGGDVDGNYVKVKSDNSGTLTVTGSSGTCTSNSVTINVYDKDSDSSGSCKITSVSTSSSLVSHDADSYSSNSYYVVFVNVEGTNCAGRTLKVTATNGGVTPGSVTVGSSRSSQYSFHVYPNLGCNQSSTPTASLSGSNSMSGSSVTLTSDWTDTRNICVSENGVSYNSFLKADIAGASEYYSNWDSEKQCYTVKWTRGCETGGGGGGGSSVTPTPSNPPKTTYACYANAKDLINATSAVWATGSSSSYPYLISGKNQSECKAYACFVNSDGTDYKWANSTPSGYKKVDNILSQSLCKKEEDACYIDKSGEYHWGKYKNNSDYTFVASITNESKCKKNDDAACYSNGDKFVWDVTPPDDTYIKVPDMDTSVKCAKDDNGCFLHDNKYYWGNYFNKSDYYFVAGITEQDYCSNYGCYYNGSEYVWGDYSDDSSYQLVKDIIDRDKCGYTPDVPMTSLNVQTIVYIAVAVMSVFGIYFVVRYNNKSKNI